MSEKKAIPSIKTGDNLRSYPDLSHLTPMERVRAMWGKRSFYEIADEGFLVREYKYGSDDSDSYRFQGFSDLSEIDGLVKYAKDMREFWLDFVHAMKGGLRLPVFDVHVGKLSSGESGIIALVEKIKEVKPENKEEEKEMQKKCERMWTVLVSHLENSDYSTDRIWWDNKRQQFVYGIPEKSLDVDQMPEWYLVDIDLKTTTKDQNRLKDGTHNLKYKYLDSLNAFYKAGEISDEFYNLAKKRIEVALDH